MPLTLTDILGRWSVFGDYDRKPCRISEASEKMRELESYSGNVTLRIRADIGKMDRRMLADRRHLLSNITRKQECRIITGSKKFNKRQRRKEKITFLVKWTLPKEPQGEGEFSAIIGATCVVPFGVARVMIGRQKYGVLFEEVGADNDAPRSASEVNPSDARAARKQAAEIGELKAALKAQSEQIAALIALQTSSIAKQEKEPQNPKRKRAK